MQGPRRSEAIGTHLRGEPARRRGRWRGGRGARLRGDGRVGRARKRHARRARGRCRDSPDPHHQTRTATMNNVRDEGDEVGRISSYMIMQDIEVRGDSEMRAMRWAGMRNASVLAMHRIP